MSTVFDLIDGLKRIDPALLDDYEREMVSAIADIVAAINKRSQLAAEARYRGILLNAQKETEPIRERERAGERVGADVMNMILY